MLMALPTPVLALEFRDYEKKDNSVLLYIEGAYEGYSWASIMAQRNGGNFLFCPPSKLSITSNQLLSIIDAYTSDHAEAFKYPVELILGYALVYAYPC
jgi:hypothetical protein